MKSVSKMPSFRVVFRLPLLVSGVGAFLSLSVAHAEQVRHLFDSGTTQLSLQTEGACGALSVHYQAMQCNPALLREVGRNMATMAVTTMADEPTFRAIWKLLKEPLTAVDVKRLFSNQSFASFSGYGRFATSTRWFALEYIPLSVAGAYRISNPGVPLIQAAGTQKSISSFGSSQKFVGSRTRLAYRH